MNHLLSSRILQFVLPLLLPASVGEVQAAVVGNDNPTGVAGIFNGNVITGCSYDPYTGNVERTITDIAVAGAVGEISARSFSVLQLT